MKLSLIYESFLDLVSRADLIDQIKEEIVAAYKQILVDFPVVQEDHKIEQDLNQAMAMMNENAIDLKRSDPFVYAYEKFESVIRRQDTKRQHRAEVP